MTVKDLVSRVQDCIEHWNLATSETPVLLMVSGGSDSTALAYLGKMLHDEGAIGPIAMLHVNHQLRGEASDGDAAFVSQLADHLGIPLFTCEIDIAAESRRLGDNVEAVARRERYLAASEALDSLCFHSSAPRADGRVFTAHTADDRVESFYMRSIVGTGPGGFRSMRYDNGPVMRPLLGISRRELRQFLYDFAEAPNATIADESGALWREDATNAHTDRFRSYVRHKMVPLAKERNPQLLEVLGRTMDLIGDEDDMLDDMASELIDQRVNWTESHGEEGIDHCAGCLIAPELGASPVPLQRRVVVRVLQAMLPKDTRIETATVDGVLGGWLPYEKGAPGACLSGYVVNVQGNLAVSANKQGVRVEPMAAFRARRKMNRKK